MCVFCREEGHPKFLHLGVLFPIRTEQDTKWVKSLVALDRQGQIYCPIVDDFVLQKPPDGCPFQTELMMLMDSRLIGD